jgi:hypothetical protein
VEVEVELVQLVEVEVVQLVEVEVELVQLV